MTVFAGVALRKVEAGGRKEEVKPKTTVRPAGSDATRSATAWCVAERSVQVLGRAATGGAPTAAIP